jgi:hypothetical protein
MNAKRFLAFSAHLCVLRASAVKAVHARQLCTERSHPIERGNLTH